MAKTEMLRARMEPDLKHHAEEIFKELGLSTTQALILFYRQVIMAHGLPFEVKIPNKVTQDAMEDVRLKRNLTTYNSINDLLGKIEE